MSITVNAFTTANSDCDAALAALIAELTGTGQYISGSSATGLCKYLLTQALTAYGTRANYASYGGEMFAANAASGSLVSGSFAVYGV